MKAFNSLCRCSFLTIALFDLTACTMLVWSEKPITSTETITEDGGTDKVSAFGVVNQNNGGLEKGSLLVMGERYWYAISPSQQITQELLPVLTAGLPKRLDMPPLAKFDNDRKDKSFSITINPYSAEFKTKIFCLGYQTSKAKERAILAQSGFTERLAGKYPGYYINCFSAEGKIFTNPGNTGTNYQFGQAIPIKLTFESQRTKRHKDNLAKRIALLPLTLAGDVLSIVTVYPALTILGARCYDTSCR